MADFTKREIERSFIRLINERPLDKITVKDIVDDCGINRRTFYYHFQDIYAVVDDIFRSETDAALAYSGNAENWQEGFIAAARFALENKRAINHIYNSVSRERVESYLQAAAKTAIEKYISAKLPQLEVPQSDRELIVSFYKHALTGMLIEWVSGGMKGPVEDMIRRSGYLFEGNIAASFERSKGKREQE